MRYNVSTNLEGDIPMNVFYNFKNTVEFGTLKSGDAFFLQGNGKLYFKLNTVYTDDGWHYNAFSFETNDLTVFDNGSLVLPVKAEITLKI